MVLSKKHAKLIVQGYPKFQELFWLNSLKGKDWNPESLVFGTYLRSLNLTDEIEDVCTAYSEIDGTSEREITFPYIDNDILSKARGLSLFN